MITIIDLHLEYKMKNGIYPPDARGSRYQLNISEISQRKAYIKWLEDKLLSIYNQSPNVSEHFTCSFCTDNDECKFAFDPYNKDGDCLAIK